MKNVNCCLNLSIWDAYKKKAIERIRQRVFVYDSGSLQIPAVQSPRSWMTKARRKVDSSRPLGMTMAALNWRVGRGGGGGGIVGCGRERGWGVEKFRVTFAPWTPSRYTRNRFRTRVLHIKHISSTCVLPRRVRSLELFLRAKNHIFFLKWKRRERNIFKNIFFSIWTKMVLI